jgi:uncharacterized protein
MVRLGFPQLIIPRTRHPELVSGSILPFYPSVCVERWTLKQVQGDENGSFGYQRDFPILQAQKMIRDDIKAAQISAMKAGEKERLAAVRLILAKLKDRDIELRTASTMPDDDAVVVEVLQKMVKQRRESIALYEQGGRQELADVEKAELAVIERFLPAQMSEAETTAAIEAIKAELGASSVKDMGRVIAELKARHGPSLDMGKASALVKAALA